jgi:hypothetical protein
MMAIIPWSIGWINNITLVGKYLTHICPLSDLRTLACHGPGAAQSFPADLLILNALTLVAHSYEQTTF